jgi:hypothetical protein
LPPLQCFTRGGDVGPILFGGPQIFFKAQLKSMKNREIADLPT